MTKTERETTSLTASEAAELQSLAETAGLTRSALLRLLALDGMRRYAPGGVGGHVDHEARVARVRLAGIGADTVEVA